MVYVDQLRDWGWYVRGKRVKSCHLAADTEAELNVFAQRLGLKPSWFQSKTFPHYDITASKRERALKRGARELSNGSFVQLLRSIYHPAKSENTEEK